MKMLLTAGRIRSALFMVRAVAPSVAPSFPVVPVFRPEY